jgi:hypothetical protein
VELSETRHVRNAFKITPVKADRKDAREITELMRHGLVPAGALQVDGGPGDTQPCRPRANWCKRRFSKLRGILRGIGLKVRKTMPAGFEGRIARRKRVKDAATGGLRRELCPEWRDFYAHG